MWCDVDRMEGLAMTLKGSSIIHPASIVKLVVERLRCHLTKINLVRRRMIFTIKLHYITSVNAEDLAYPGVVFQNGNGVRPIFFVWKV